MSHRYSTRLEVIIVKIVIVLIFVKVLIFIVEEVIFVKVVILPIVIILFVVLLPPLIGQRLSVGEVEAARRGRGDLFAQVTPTVCFKRS
jgi:hypothetical protein